MGGFVASQQGNETLAVVLGNLGVFVGLGSVLVGVQQFLAAGRDREAGAGEAPVLAQLGSRLGDDYTYLRRVTIPRHGVEADGILAGPSGALVLAIRSLQGRYVVRGNDWFVLQEDGAERPWNRSPTWELARPMRALQRAVREEGIPPLPVHGRGGAGRRAPPGGLPPRRGGRPCRPHRLLRGVSAPGGDRGAPGAAPAAGLPGAPRRGRPPTGGYPWPLRT